MTKIESFLFFGMVRVIESMLLMSSSQKNRLCYVFSPKVIREKVEITFWCGPVLSRFFFFENQVRERMLFSGGIYHGKGQSFPTMGKVVFYLQQQVKQVDIGFVWYCNSDKKNISELLY